LKGSKPFTAATTKFDLIKREFWIKSDSLNIEKVWQKHEKLVELKQNNGHCAAPQKCEQDKAPRKWVGTQRSCHENDNVRPERKELHWTNLDSFGKMTTATTTTTSAGAICVKQWSTSS
jgi:hypothetical protein